MTGPVERVPLTDEHLLQLETLWLGPDGTGRAAEALTTAELTSFGRIALEDVPGLLAELRASRAREQAQRTLREHAEHVKVELRTERDGLQQRIDKALAVCDADHRAGTVGALVAEDVPSLTPRAVRAALTGTEEETGG